jgi:XTP/dITP diphosphohydrolase
VVEGTIVWPPRGDRGFGYDPIFLPDGQEQTFGEMSVAEKHGWETGEGLSHRARAFKLFASKYLGKSP